MTETDTSDWWKLYVNTEQNSIAFLTFNLWGHNSCCSRLHRPSEAPWVSPRPHPGGDDSVSPSGWRVPHRNPPESKPPGCASGCVWSSCRAAVSLRGSPGPSPPRLAPSRSPRSDAEPPPSRAAAWPSGSVPARSEALPLDDNNTQ